MLSDLLVEGLGVIDVQGDGGGILHASRELLSAVKGAAGFQWLACCSNTISTSIGSWKRTDADRNARVREDIKRGLRDEARAEKENFLRHCWGCVSVKFFSYQENRQVSMYGGAVGLVGLHAKRLSHIGIYVWVYGAAP